MTILFRAAFVLLACIRAHAGEFRIINMEFNPHIGMFAAANQVLGQLYLYEQGTNRRLTGLSVDFDRFGAYYDPERGPNWWRYYFEPITVGRREGSRVSYPSRNEYIQVFHTRRTRISRAEAAALVKKYIHVKRPILEQADQFADRYFQNIFTIGVHYRGTDKKSEARRVPYEEVLKNILDQIPTNRRFQIFVATDEAPFVAWIREQFPHQVIATDALRSNEFQSSASFRS